MMMKVSASAAIVALALAATSSVDAYSIPTRSSLRSLGQAKQSLSGPRSTSRRAGGGSSNLKMEGTKLGFDDNWEGQECISEVGMEKRLNQDGLRYKMNRTAKEAEEVGPLEGLPAITLNLPLIGETYLGPPKVESIWEALGFTATSNNEARQQEKLKAIEKARTATKGVLNGPGAEIRGEWLEKFGYPRLVGSGGIFYADQLSSDKVPMGGFNMGKSGQIWPTPDVVKKGMYGGEKGWGMKKKGTAVDGLAPQKKGMK